MSYILNLETSSKNCSVSLLKGDKIVSIIEQEDDSYRHSELLTSFIDQILSKEKISTENLSAVSVSKGPGSFTGLRIGFSVAKGLCFPYNIPIIGTSLESIDISEDREKFKKLLNKIGLQQPKNGIARSEEESINIAAKINYPVVIRPSYVIGGRAMEIVFNEIHLKKYISHAVKVTGENPILIDSFISDAIEIDVDAISDGEKVTIVGVMQHIEEAGIHSGDSACCLPPYSLSSALITKIKTQSVLLAKELKVKGLINIQFAVREKNIYVLEVNPRASRTLPFVSKVIGKPIPGIASLIMAGIVKNTLLDPKINFFAIKEVVLPVSYTHLTLPTIYSV